MNLLQCIDPLLKFNVVCGKLCLQGRSVLYCDYCGQETKHLLVRLTELLFDKLLCSSRKGRKGGTARRIHISWLQQIRPPCRLPAESFDVVFTVDAYLIFLPKA